MNKQEMYCVSLSYDGFCRFFLFENSFHTNFLFPIEYFRIYTIEAFPMVSQLYN